jgi:hypothetical protein
MFFYLDFTISLIWFRIDFTIKRFQSPLNHNCGRSNRNLPYFITESTNDWYTNLNVELHASMYSLLSIINVVYFNPIIVSEIALSLIHHHILLPLPKKLPFNFYKIVKYDKYCRKYIWYMFIVSIFLDKNVLTSW